MTCKPMLPRKSIHRREADVGKIRLKGAFAGCGWCQGNGCMCCDAEREKAFERSKQPILSVTHEELNDPTLGPMIKDAIGADAIQEAFGPGGGGMGEIKFNCAVVSFLQAMRKRGSDETVLQEGQQQ